MDVSTGPVFEGDVAIDSASAGIYSRDNSTGPVFGGNVAIDSNGEVAIAASRGINGLKFEEEVTIDAGGDVTLRNVSTFSGRVDIVMRDRIDQTRDDVLAIIDSLFKGDLRADGRAGNNTLVESGNTFLGEADFLRFS
jgi:hypothetical protein